MTIHPLLPLPLLLILLVPLLAFCVLQAVAARRAAAPSTPAPVDGGSGARRRRRGVVPGSSVHWWLRSVAVLALAVIGLGPALPKPSEEEVGVGVDVFLVVDRTGSMAAEDYGDGQPRLDGVRADLPAVVQAVPGARYSILAWDSEATRQLPLSSDGAAVGTWASTLRQEATDQSQGSAIDRPLDALRTALETAAENEPGHVRLVFFLSDGEQTDDGEVRSYAEMADLVDGGAVLGYGTAEGGRMLRDDGASYIQDTDGSDAVSTIDEDALRTVAEDLGLTYLHRSGAGDTDLAEVVGDVQAESEVRAEGRVVTIWNPVVWPAAAVLLLALLGEMWLLVVGWVRLGRSTAAGSPAGDPDPGDAPRGPDDRAADHAPASAPAPAWPWSSTPVPTSRTVRAMPFDTNATDSSDTRGDR